MASRQLTVNIVGDASKLEKEIGKASGTLGKFGKTAAALAAGAALAVVGIVGSLVAIGDQFQQADNIIRSGTGATGAALEELTENFRNVLGTVPEGMDTVASAVADLNTFTGATGKTLEHLTRTALAAGRVMGEDTAGLIENTGRALKVFGIDAVHGAGVIDTLLVASQTYGLSMTKLGGQLQTFGPVLKNMGFGIEESTALFGGLHAAGVDVSRVMPGMNAFSRKLAAEGVTDLKGAFNDVVAEIRDASSVTEGLNIATKAFGAEGAQRMTNAIRSGELAIEDFNLGMGGMSDKLFDAGGTTAALAKENLTLGERFTILKNKGLVALEPLASKALELASAFVDKAVPAVEKHLPRAIAFLKPKLEGVGTFITDVVVPALRDHLPEAIALVREKFEGVGTFITDVVVPALRDHLPEAIALVREKFEQVAEVVREDVLPVLERIIEVATDMGQALKDKLQGPIEAVVGFFRDNKIVMQGFAVGLGVLATAWAVYTTAQLAATIAASVFSAVPIILIIIGIVVALTALGVGIILLVKGIILLVKHWDEITEKVPWLGKAFDAVKKGILAFVSWLRGDFIGGIQQATGFVRQHWGKIVAIFDGPIKAARVALETVFESMRVFIETQIDVIVGIVKAVLAIFQGDWDTAWNEIKGIVDTVWKAIKELIGIAITAVLTILAQPLEDIKNALTGAWDFIRNETGRIWGEARDKAKEMLDDIVTALLELPGRIATKALWIGIAMIGLGRTMKDKLVDGLLEIAGKVSDIKNALIDALKGAWNAMIDWADANLKFTVSLPGWLGGKSWTFDPVLEFAKFAKGGIVTKPTLALIGESGPEAVVPLNRLGDSDLGGGVTVIANFEGAIINVQSQEDLDAFVDDFGHGVSSALRARGAA